jgi:hypothetical protein
MSTASAGSDFSRGALVGDVDDPGLSVIRRGLAPVQDHAGPRAALMLRGHDPAVPAPAPGVRRWVRGYRLLPPRAPRSNRHFAYCARLLLMISRRSGTPRGGVPGSARCKGLPAGIELARPFSCWFRCADLPTPGRGETHRPITAGREMDLLCRRPSLLHYQPQ